MEVNEKPNFVKVIKRLRHAAHDTIKGYLHYKTITSQQMASEAQVKNFFIT